MTTLFDVVAAHQRIAFAQRPRVVGAVDRREASRNASPALYPTFGRYPDYTQQSKERFHPQAAGAFRRAVP
jgi:hypothetical protein